MSNPWLKFYPSDWRSDPALRMCSIAARGLWMEMLCVMHENGGDLAINAKGLMPRQLANLAGCGVDEVDALLSELEDAGVFSRREDGTIYSRRMIRDAEKAERDKANGRKGGNPAVMSKVGAGVNPEVKAQKPEARSLDLKEEPNGSSKKRAVRLPDDFSPDLQWAIEKGLSPSQAQTEADKFRDYWNGKGGASAAKLDWPGTWRNWVRSAVERLPRASPPKASTSSALADSAARLVQSMRSADEIRSGSRGSGIPALVSHLPVR